MDEFCGTATRLLLIKTSLSQTINWENTPFGTNANTNLMDKETTLENHKASSRSTNTPTVMLSEFGGGASLKRNETPLCAERNCPHV